MHLIKSEINGIIFEIAKGGDNTIIVLPGLPEYPRPKSKMIELVKKGYNIIYPRYRGTFESSGTFLKYSPAIDILELIDNLDKEMTNLYDSSKYNVNSKSITIIGSSFGGSVALDLMTRTDKVTRYILSAPVVDYKKIDLRKLEQFLEHGFKNIYRFNQEDFKKLTFGELLKVPTEVKNTIIIHGIDDPVVSIEQSKCLTGAKLKEIKTSEHISLMNSKLLDELL